MNTFLITACYDNKQKTITFKTTKTLQEVRDGIIKEAYESRGFYIFDNEFDDVKDVSGVNLSNADTVYIRQL